MKRASINLVALLVVAAMVSGVFATGDNLYPLMPKGKDRLVTPNESLDPIYTYSHVDDVAEYYLGSGAADDTFFIVFEPPAACSVKYAEIQWFDGGNANAFAAWYSDAATTAYPGGQAPDRGTSPVSPVGEWIAGPVPNTAEGTQDWELLDLGGTEFISGDPLTLDPGIFGVGFIKGAETPHPLADRMDSKGLRFTYTWFGGPWMATYDEDWGAYSGDIQGSTVVDVMMQVWVSYPWGMPILITELDQLPNTYDTAGPYTVNVKLVDDAPGITAADECMLYYSDDVTTNSVPLNQTAPGSDYFCADIPGMPVGTTVSYWVECVDDVGLESFSFQKNFSIVAPMRPDADLLLIDDGMDDRFDAFWWALDELGYYAEYWDVAGNSGIDNSVINHGWGTILVGGWGISSVPCLDEETPYSDFLDAGNNMALIDQDWFYAQGLPAEGSFIAGDFAYDYFGLNEYWNDFGTPDTSYFGVGGDPITNDWENDTYMTYWEPDTVFLGLESLWADWFTEGAAENIFFGENDGNSYGCRYDNGYKTAFLSFMADANCGYDTSGYWAPTEDFSALISNTLLWFETEDVEGEVSLSPLTYSLNQNYPNPFNPTTAISFILPNSGKVSLKVFNMMGQDVATVIDGNMNSGSHQVNFDAAGLSSGVYYYKMQAGDFNSTKQMILVK